MNIPKRFAAPLLLCMLVPAAAFSIVVGVPDPWLSTATTRATEDVSLMICPGCDGASFSQARLLGGGTMDATIDVHVLDTNGDPLPMFPFQDFWLYASTLNPTRHFLDHDTDYMGYSLFALPLCGGGYLEDPGLEAYVYGDPLASNPIAHIRINSPDINGDLSVNLQDATMFIGDYLSGGYHYRSDLHYDGNLNLQDVVVFVAHFGH